MAPSGAGVSSGAYGELLVVSLVVLAAICVLAYVVVRVARKYLSAPRGQGGLLEVVARVPLEPRRSLYVVDVGGKALLVGTSEMGLTMLAELDREQIESSRTAVAARPTFVDMVQAAIVKRRRRRDVEPADPMATRAVALGPTSMARAPVDPIAGEPP